MYGNVLGWKISGVLAGLIIGALVAVHFQINNTTGATNFSWDPKVTKPLELPSAAHSVVSMNSPGDAGPLYRQAINLYKANPSGRNVACTEPIVSATSLQDINLFITAPEEVVNYRLTKTPLEQMLAAAECTGNQGSRLMSTNPAAAERYFQAVYALGYKMFKERLCFREGFDAIGVMNSGLMGMMQLAHKNNDSAREANLRKLYDELRGLASNNIMAVNMVINKAYQQDAFGDIYSVAAKCPDRMWRTEALLAMGRYRFNAKIRADQRAAENLLTKCLDDRDPAVRAAAKAGLDLTAEHYRDLASDPDKWP